MHVQNVHFPFSLVKVFTKLDVLTINTQPSPDSRNANKIFDLLGAPRVLEVLLELVHPDRVVHLPLVRVQAAAGGGEAGGQGTNQGHNADHHDNHDNHRDDDGQDACQRKTHVRPSWLEARWWASLNWQAVSDRDNSNLSKIPWHCCVICITWICEWCRFFILIAYFLYKSRFVIAILHLEASTVQSKQLCLFTSGCSTQPKLASVAQREDVGNGPETKKVLVSLSQCSWSDEFHCASLLI